MCLDQFVAHSLDILDAKLCSGVWIHRKLLSSPLIKGNAKLPFKKASISQKWKEFYKLVLEHDRIANPFCKNTDLLKNPSEYLDKVNISIAFDKNIDIASSVKFGLKNKNSCTDFGDGKS